LASERHEGGEADCKGERVRTLSNTGSFRVDVVVGEPLQEGRRFVDKLFALRRKEPGKMLCGWITA
jgi:hypothetical protein